LKVKQFQSPVDSWPLAIGKDCKLNTEQVEVPTDEENVKIANCQLPIAKRS